MKYENSTVRKMFSKTKTVKHERLTNNFLHGSGPLKGAWHIEEIQKPYNQIVKKKTKA